MKSPSRFASGIHRNEEMAFSTTKWNSICEFASEYHQRRSGSIYTVSRKYWVPFSDAHAFMLRQWKIATTEHCNLKKKVAVLDYMIMSRSRTLFVVERTSFLSPKKHSRWKLICATRYFSWEIFNFHTFDHLANAPDVLLQDMDILGKTTQGTLHFEVTSKVPDTTQKYHYVRHQ